MLFRREPEQLMEAAERALEQGDPRKAARFAEQLLRMRHTAGFEIKARALWAMGRPEDAIATLQEGVAIAPEVWILWEYLGRYLSDAGRYSEALDAFRSGLACPNAPQDGFLFNLAIVYQRLGEYDNALQMLEQAESVRSNLPLAWLEAARAYCLIQQKRYAEAERSLERAQHALNTLDDPWTRGAVEAMVHAYTGLLYWQRDGDLARAREHAERALHWDKTNPDAVALMRAGNPIADKPTPLWHILVEGVWHEPLEGMRTPAGFFANYWVIADTPDEALDYIRPFEPPSVRDSLKVSEATVESTVQGERKGVVRALAGYTFYASD
ncbi:Tetratricopeptide repeat-containing protein [Armatimonadetes bacterium GBS]|jgi:tetratricopeptide (TPR) repeat protein|nr:Tetratricopeptide repeat-containing protein [Armatimonadetes bacterium GBS]CUU36418.1 Tetratricopeptide repeat-containing protein [Armatimonadetes bacterium GXS]